jgi:hypothetical protein
MSREFADEIFAPVFSGLTNLQTFCTVSGRGSCRLIRKPNAAARSRPDPRAAVACSKWLRRLTAMKARWAATFAAAFPWPVYLVVLRVRLWSIGNTWPLIHMERHSLHACKPGEKAAQTAPFLLHLALKAGDIRRNIGALTSYLEVGTREKISDPFDFGVRRVGLDARLERRCCDVA